MHVCHHQDRAFPRRGLERGCPAGGCCMLGAVLRLGVPWGFFMPVVHEGCSGGVCAPARLAVAYAELPKPPPWAFVGRGCRPHCRRNLPLTLLGLLDSVLDFFGSSFIVDLNQCTGPDCF